MWVAKLKVDYPRIIRDDSANERFLKFLSMKTVGKVHIKENLELKEATEREECIRSHFKIVASEGEKNHYICLIRHLDSS